MRFPRAILAIGFTLSALSFAGCGGKEKYIRPVVNEPFTSTPERVARGSYIVNTIGACNTCHAKREGASFENPEGTELMAGGTVLHDGPIEAYIPNVTPDVETGIGSWSDDEIARAIRDGVRKDGTLMFPMMPFPSYQYMSDEDVQSLAQQCRFRDCRHEGEPGGAVLAHVDADRLANYKKLMRDAERGEMTALERIELRGKWKAIGKAGSRRAREKRA